MNRLLIALSFIICHLSFSPAGAQTQVGPYFPGVTQSGATFFLPKTALRISVLIEKTTYTPGTYASYAQRYLRLNNVSTEASVDYRVISITQTPMALADTTKAFSVKFNRKTSAINVALSEEGTLLALNATPQRQAAPKRFEPARKPAPLNPQRYLNEEILAAGSMSKMAQLTAQEIYDIRDNRNQLVKGQADFMPKDGKQMELMLGQLDLQDRALTSLFAGVTERDTVERIIVLCPHNDTSRELLFRFSEKLGLVDDDDLVGEPYYIQVKNLTVLPATDKAAEAKKKKQEDGLYYNVPGKMRSTIYKGNEQLASDDFPAGQFGKVELLEGELFNKHYGTRLWLNPLTGAIDKLEAERPK